MGGKEKNPVPGANADNARREREKSVSDDRSGAQAQQARERAKDDIKRQGVDRASNAAMGHRPVG
jgi:hypothetical protein